MKRIVGRKIVDDSKVPDSLRVLDITQTNDREVCITINGFKIQVGLNCFHPGQLHISADDTLLIKPLATNCFTVRPCRD
jgi:hypothetical protein